MTHDDVMALANQTAGQHWMDEAHIQRFAALVAAAERRRLQAQRDALLEALKNIERSTYDAGTAALARAAIAKTEGNT